MIAESYTSSLTQRLLANSRFWILAWGATISVLVAGIVQMYVPEGSLQIIRIEQCYGFISLLLLYLAILASPLTKVFPTLTIKSFYLHARRAIGVLTFYYAFLHVYLSFFKQLNGFSGISYFDTKYNLSLALGAVALAILCLLALTSLDYAIKIMHFKNWKLLHRFVYLAALALLIHITLIGPHYTSFTAIGIVTYVAAGVLIILEIVRVQRNFKSKAAAR